MFEPTGKQTLCLTAALIAMGCLALLAWTVWPKSARAPEWMAEYDVAARPPESIVPGTVIGRVAPESWSHLIIKSLPRVRPDEIENIPRNPLVDRARTAQLASWMFTAFVADVRLEMRDGMSHHRIRSIALGLGTAEGGRDIIVTPETAVDHGVELGVFTRDILSNGYKVQHRARVIIQGHSFAMVDTPVTFHSDGRNRPLRFRYALLVDAAGRLETVVWLIDAEGTSGDGSIVILPPNCIDEAELIPDPSQFNALGIPSEDAFAVDRLPHGRARVLLPPDLRPLATQGKYTAAEAAILETRLRQLIAPHQ